MMDKKPIVIDDLKDVLDIIERFAHFVKDHPFGVSFAIVGLMVDAYFINNKEEK